MKRLVRWLLLLVTGSASAARAQSSDLQRLLDEPIVSTPSKGSETSSTAPATSMTISADELRTYGIRSLDEAINYLSLGMTTTNPLHAVEVGARGVLLNGDYGNHVLLMVDGHVLNEASAGTAYFERGAGIPFELIDHIEVTLGPGSVMYGSQAMLGIINIVTKRANAYAGLHIVAEAGALPPMSSQGSIQLTKSGYGWDYRVGAGYGKDFLFFGTAAELTTELEYYKLEGPDWTFPLQVWGDDSVTRLPKNFGPKGVPGSWGGTARNSHAVEVPTSYTRLRLGDFEMALRAGIYRRGIPYLAGLVSTTSDFDEPSNYELDRFLNLELRYRKPITSMFVVRTRAFADINEYNWNDRTSAAENCESNQPNGCVSGLKGIGRSIGAELQGELSSTLWRASTLVGVEARLRNALYNSSRLDILTGRDESSSLFDRTDGLVAPYLQQALSPWSWLDLSAGLRLDYDDRFGSNLSPRAAAGVSPWPGGRLKLIYSEAFRAPTAYELDYTDTGSTVAPLGLDPETVRSAEVSTEQRFGVHSLFFGVFRSAWNDMVGYQVITGPELDALITSGDLNPGVEAGYRRKNLGAITNHGYNAGYAGAAFEKHLRFGLRVTGAYTRIDPGDGSDPQRLVLAPTFFGNAHASYAFGPRLPTLGLAAFYLKRRPAEHAFDGAFTTPPYAPPHVEIRTTLSGESPFTDALLYRISMTYLTASTGGYTIGPHQYAVDETTEPLLSPNTRLHGFLGLEYVW